MWLVSPCCRGGGRGPAPIDRLLGVLKKKMELFTTKNLFRPKVSNQLGSRHLADQEQAGEGLSRTEYLPKKLFEWPCVCSAVSIFLPTRTLQENVDVAEKIGKS